MLGTGIEFVRKPETRPEADLMIAWRRECLAEQSPVTRVDVRPMNGGFFLATYALRDGVVRGIGQTYDEALSRARSLSGRRVN